MEKLNVKRIIAVEDSNTIRRILVSILKEIGFTKIDEAENGVAALAKIRSTRYDLIISDWDMEPMSGLELLEAVRRDHSTAFVPFIMASAKSQRDYVQVAMAAGATAYLGKPYDAKSIRALVGSCFPEAA